MDRITDLTQNISFWIYLKAQNFNSKLEIDGKLMVNPQRGFAPTTSASKTTWESYFLKPPMLNQGHSQGLSLCLCFMMAALLPQLPPLPRSVSQPSSELKMVRKEPSLHSSWVMWVPIPPTREDIIPRELMQTRTETPKPSTTKPLKQMSNT